MASSFFIASSLFCDCVRCSCEVTMSSMPPATTRFGCAAFKRSIALSSSTPFWAAFASSRRTSTFVLSLFTFWPPGPEDRAKESWQQSPRASRTLCLENPRRAPGPTGARWALRAAADSAEDARPVMTRRVGVRTAGARRAVRWEKQLIIS
eukprot:CAMPEP_0206817334 /NCGR_PEP_ID=MMETSP0975-20121206/10244_1 /ASSEMBLY_ACC=CAM_ASM_000399 /TAXON_ID=483370 /ORGANISM="non described non described, Strain CCMP2097" /LENGTH=150 /DNA_ID=CAMNT_0054359533 /DNA_START=264 /DNA_END=716 /DNA_ORIENTATION=-